MGEYVLNIPMISIPVGGVEVGLGKIMAMTTRKAFSNTYKENNVPSSKPPQRLKPQQLDERRAKGL